MKSFFSLLRLYVVSVYNPRAIIDLLKQGPKGIAKALGILILVIYGLASFSSIMLVSSYSSYAGLKPLGLEQLVLLNAISSSTAIVIVIGFAASLATYFLSGAESSFLSMPLAPRALFGAKFAMTYLTEALLGSLMLAVSCGVYAYFESPPPLFYLYAFLIAAATPLLPLSFFYFILVPLMSGLRFFRRKDFIVIVGGFVGILMAMLWQLYAQRLAINAGDSQWLLDNLANPDSILMRFSRLFPPALFGARALMAPSSLEGFLYLAAYLGLQLCGLGLALLFLPGPYVRSLSSYNEVGVSPMARSQGYIPRVFRPRPAFVSLLLREIRLMNREPVFFLNGPFVIILVPLLLGVVYGSMKEKFLADIPALSGPGASSLLALVAFGMSAFLGSVNGIACTSVSREGRQLAYLKSLPLGPASYLGAKLVHALIFAFLAGLGGPLAVYLVFPFPPQLALIAGLSGFGLSSLLCLIGILLDLSHPRLDWPNPQAAIKQNPVYALMIPIAMGLIGLCCALIALFPGQGFIMPLCGIGALSLCLGLAALLAPSAALRMERIQA